MKWMDGWMDAFFFTLNAVIQYMYIYIYLFFLYIWPTFSKRKGSIINNRYIWNKIPSFQTTLGLILIQFRPKQTLKEKTKF